MIMGLISLEKLKIRESPINGLVVLMIRRTTTIVFWLTHWTLWVGGLQETTLLLISKTLIHTHKTIRLPSPLFFRSASPKPFLKSLYHRSNHISSIQTDKQLIPPPISSLLRFVWQFFWTKPRKFITKICYTTFFLFGYK